MLPIMTCLTYLCCPHDLLPSQHSTECVARSLALLCSFTYCLTQPYTSTAFCSHADSANT